MGIAMKNVLIVVAVMIVAMVPLMGCNHQPQTPMERAAHYYGLGEWDEAIAACDEAIQQDPHKLDGYFYRGKANIGKHDYAAAVKDLKNALKIDPNYIEALYRLEIAYKGIGNLKAARECRRKADALDPDYQKDYSEGIVNRNPTLPALGGGTGPAKTSQGASASTPNVAGHGSRGDSSLGGMSGIHGSQRHGRLSFDNDLAEDETPAAQAPKRGYSRFRSGVPAAGRGKVAASEDSTKSDDPTSATSAKTKTTAPSEEGTQTASDSSEGEGSGKKVTPAVPTRRPVYGLSPGAMPTLVPFRATEAPTTGLRRRSVYSGHRPATRSTATWGVYPRAGLQGVSNRSAYRAPISGQLAQPGRPYSTHRLPGRTEPFNPFAVRGILPRPGTSVSPGNSILARPGVSPTTIPRWERRIPFQNNSSATSNVPRR